MNRQTIPALISILLFMAMPASAHTGAGAVQGFAAGFLHPWSGIDHLLAMLAVGLWATARGGCNLWLLPATFLAAMMAGAGLRFFAFTLDGMETWVAFSVLALGLLLASRHRLATILATTLVAAFALGHGYVHAAEIGADAHAMTYACGFLTATSMILGAGLAAGFAGQAGTRTLHAVFAGLCMLVGTVLLAGG